MWISLKIFLWVLSIWCILLIFIVWRFFYELSYYEYLSSVATENGVRYSLYKERGFGDTAWVVLESSNIENYKKVTHMQKPLIGYTFPMIMRNRNDGCNYDNPKLLIHEDTYLIFERWGMYHSIYDIQKGKIILNYWDIKQEYKKQTGYDAYECSVEYLNWKKKNLHDKIKIIYRAEAH